MKPAIDWWGRLIWLWAIVILLAIVVGSMLLPACDDHVSPCQQDSEIVR